MLKKDYTFLYSTTFRIFRVPKEEVLLGLLYLKLAIAYLSLAFESLE